MDRKTILDSIKQYIDENNFTDREISEYLENIKIDVFNYLFKDKEGQYVLKKKGTVELFDKDKIYNSLASSSDSIGETMPASDIKIVVSDVEKDIKNLNRKIVTTIELRNFVTNSLKENRYTELEKHYNI